MRVAIVVCSGPATGRRIQLKASQLAKFGRSNWADFAFPEDSALADIHFEIQCDSTSCTIASLAKEHPTWLNKEPVTKCRLNSGDVIQAGQTQLTVEIHGGSESAVENAAAVAAVVATVDPDLTAQTSAYIELSEPALSLAKDHRDPDSFEQRLIAEKHWEDAVRWRAHHLPKPQAVAWMLACLKDAQVPVNQADCDAAASWANDPSEENRCRNMERLEINGGKGLPGAVVAAAAWSGGSLAPEGIDAVPPDDRLTGHCVATALKIMSHLSHSPGSPGDRLKKYLQTTV